MNRLAVVSALWVLSLAGLEDFGLRDGGAQSAQASDRNPVPAPGVPGARQPPATTKTALKPPAVPANLAAAIALENVELSWRKQAGDQSGFRIERKTGAGQFIEIGTAGPGGTNFTDAKVQPGQCSYRVRSFVNDGRAVLFSAYSNEAEIAVPAKLERTLSAVAAKPSAFGGLEAPGVSSGIAPQPGAAVPARIALKPLKTVTQKLSVIGLVPQAMLRARVFAEKLIVVGEREKTSEVAKVTTAKLVVAGAPGLAVPQPHVVTQSLIVVGKSFKPPEPVLVTTETLAVVGLP